MKKGLLVFLAIIAIVLIGGCNYYKSKHNLMNGLQVEVKAKWAEVQNQYQRRYDLIDNLVATVKGAAEHERSTLEAVINARAKASQMTIDPENLTPEKLAEFQAAQGELSQALGRLMVVQEQYPDLKANQNFLALQHEVAGTENRIAVARGKYNESVRDYNKVLGEFPLNLFASAMGFQKQAEFTADAEAQRAPKISF